MAETKLVDNVCTANIGRSRISENVMQHQFKELGVEDEFKATSSGIKAYDIKNRIISMEGMQHFIEKAYKQGMLTPHGKRIYSTAKDRGDEIAVKNVYRDVKNSFDERASKEMGQAIEWLREEKGIIVDPEHEPTQTAVNEDNIAVLTMTNKHAEFARNLYSNNKTMTKLNKTEQSIQIETIGSFATNKPIEVKDAYGEPEGAFMEATKQITELASVSSNKIVQMYL